MLSCLFSCKQQCIYWLTMTFAGGRSKHVTPVFLPSLEIVKKSGILWDPFLWRASVVAPLPYVITTMKIRSSRNLPLFWQVLEATWEWSALFLRIFTSICTLKLRSSVERPVFARRDSSGGWKWAIRWRTGSLSHGIRNTSSERFWWCAGDGAFGLHLG